MRDITHARRQLEDDRRAPPGVSAAERAADLLGEGAHEEQAEPEARAGRLRGEERLAGARRLPSALIPRPLIDHLDPEAVACSRRSATR